MARQLTESESALVREMGARIRELEGDLSNARHDLQAVHALHERMRQAEAERDEARKRIRELEGAVRSARLEIEGVIRERDEARRQVARLTNDRAEAWHALSLADKHFSAKNWEAVRKILCDSAATTHVATFVAAHDARVRAEGHREGLRQAVAFLRAEADRREPHAEADALRVRGENLEVG